MGVYRDLKPENVLIDKDWYPLICDFGFAKFVADKTYTLCGTPNYLSPEIIMNRGHDASTDHWALGILIYEMVAGENPFYYDGIPEIKTFSGSDSDESFRSDADFSSRSMFGHEDSDYYSSLISKCETSSEG